MDDGFKITLKALQFHIGFNIFTHCWFQLQDVYLSDELILKVIISTIKLGVSSNQCMQLCFSKFVVQLAS